MTVTNSIEVRGLVKRYGDVTAVDGVDLSIAPNTIYALLGPNGAGKTTTISVLTTLTRLSAGSASVMGLDVSVQPNAVRQCIGVTFQETVLDDALNAWQTLDFHGRLYRQDRATRKRKSQELLKMVELEEAAERRVRTYSGGMKRRLELARGLMTDPDVLFLDEPTTGLDPQNRANIWEYIRDLKQRNGLTLLLTTHYMDEAEELADRVGIIDHGKIIVEGSPRELVSQMGADSITLVASGDTVRLAERLKTLTVVETVTIGDQVIQIGVDSGNRRLPEIIGLAQEVGCHIEDISLAKPSLSDVFLKYTGRQLRDK
ncbi:MAG: ATP-binding cassette domain-containing protein [Chloroflexi bacterium]|nr:ATP-binding cassette domain-containing protein [Chloroflexota bacterium]